MSAEGDTKRHAIHRLAGRSDHQVVQHEAISLGLRIAQHSEVGFSAEGGFNGKAVPAFEQAARFLDQEAPRFEGHERGVERRQSPAISSALRKRISPIRGKSSRASVVFPAPLQPPTMQRVGCMRILPAIID